MFNPVHNHFREGLQVFEAQDPHLLALSKLPYQYDFDWWGELDFNEPGIYILTGGRQVGKSTSCKLLIKYCLTHRIFKPSQMQYLACDEIFDAKELGQLLRNVLSGMHESKFLLIVDEITYVKNWERVIKSLADEGHFANGLLVLTGSDSNILKEAAMSFPGRRGNARKTDFHLSPLSFSEYLNLVAAKEEHTNEFLKNEFNDFLKCGGYLRAINDLKQKGEILEATYQTYQQWIRGDFLKQGKNEEYLLQILQALLLMGVSTISYSKLTQKIGSISKETLIDYCRLLERMDILLTLQAYDQNKQQGFPRKDRKFHFHDPFITHAIIRWLRSENQLHNGDYDDVIVEAIVASDCQRQYKTFYFKGTQGEIDVIALKGKQIEAIEVKWTNQIRPGDFKTLKQFQNNLILTKHNAGEKEGIIMMPVYEYLLNVA